MEEAVYQYSADGISKSIFLILYGPLLHSLVYLNPA